MKKWFLLAALTGRVLCANAQTQPHHPFEVGVDGANYAFISSPMRPKFQGISGAFFRYTFQRVGLRAGLAFNQQTTPANTSNCSDCLSGETAYKTTALRLGGQYAILPQAPWLYTFVDVAYRNTRGRGEYTGGLCGCLDNSVTQTTRAMGAMVGAGATLRIVSRFSLVPELYYESFLGEANYFSLDNRTGSTSNWKLRTKEHAPALRLHATVSF